MYIGKLPNTSMNSNIINKNNRYFSSVNSYYDSQSGQYITVSSGLTKYNDCTWSPNHFHKEASNTKSILNLSEIEAFTKSFTPESVEVNMEQYQVEPSALARVNSGNVFIPVRTVEDIKQIASQRSCKGVVLYLPFSPSCYKNKDFVEQLNTAKSLKLQVQVKLLIDLSSDVDVVSISTGIASLFDLGARQIFVCNTSPSHIDEDSLRLIAEDAFNLDVEGDPVSERLGFQGSQIDDYKTASELGFKRLVTCAEISIPAVQQILASTDK